MKFKGAHLNSINELWFPPPLQVLGTEDDYIGSLAFGVTNADPSTFDTRDLPEDADSLLDRPEYWVVAKVSSAACL